MDGEVSSRTDSFLRPLHTATSIIRWFKRCRFPYFRVAWTDRRDWQAGTLDLLHLFAYRPEHPPPPDQHQVKCIFVVASKSGRGWCQSPSYYVALNPSRGPLTFTPTIAVNQPWAGFSRRWWLCAGGWTLSSTRRYSSFTTVGNLILFY